MDVHLNKEKQMIGLLVLLGIIVVLFVWIVGMYNGLVMLRNRFKNAFAQIDVQLKRRYDLIPNLVETAKGYMEHERETLEAVIKARQVAIDASTVKEQASAENMLTSTLRSLMAVSENYPDIKADTQMQELHEEIASTENRIGFARQHYNDAVMRFNNLVQMFPGSVIAGRYQFLKRDYFELQDEVQREPVKVAF
jgi:LemA protein